MFYSYTNWGDLLIYSQSRDDVPCILNKLIEVSHLAAFGELICQIDLQVMQLIWDGHVYKHNNQMTPW